MGIVELASPKSPNRAWREWFAPLLPDVLREIESGQRFIEVRWWQYLYEQMELIPFAVRNGTVFGLGIAQSRGENGIISASPAGLTGLGVYVRRSADTPLREARARKPVGLAYL